MDSSLEPTTKEESKRRILLCSSSFREPRGWYWPSLAPLVLVSFLRSRPALAPWYEFLNLDFDEEDSAESIAAAVLESDPWLVGWSVYIWNVERILSACRLVKARKKDARIILGGPQV